jgi:chemotaxis protein MotB
MVYRLKQLKEELQKISAQLSVVQNNIHISGNEERIEINLNANILFAVGDAEPSYAAEVIFEEIANQLIDSDSSIDVEGYTDNQPINTARYPSNWQLASARAASIVQLLQGFGIAPDRLSAIGYGEFRPVAENDSPEGRARNRRVVLVLHRESVKRPVLQAIDLSKVVVIENPTIP